MTDRNEINTAIVAVMKEVRRLKKADENAFARYNFTSVDDFKEHIRPLMAKNGLTPDVSEVSFDMLDVVSTDKSGKERTSSCAKVTFDIILQHVSGQATSPERRTIVLPYVGAQTTGAASSYVVKEWMKTRFLASSGDMEGEADLQDHSDVTLSKKDARPVYSELSAKITEIAATNDRQALVDWAVAERAKIAELPDDFRKSLRTEYTKALNSIEVVDMAEAKPAAVEPVTPEMLVDWAERLAMADEEGKAEIWEIEIDPAAEAGRIDKSDLEALRD